MGGSSAISEVAEGQVRIVPDPRDERIGELERRVRERTIELQQAYDQLEERAQERTYELHQVITGAHCLLWHSIIEKKERYEWDICVFNEAAAQRVVPLATSPKRPYAMVWEMSKHADDRPQMDETSTRALDEKRDNCLEEEWRKRLVIRTRHERDRGVVVEVEDNGTGMGEEIRKRLCQPFFTTKEPDKGTGLGLSISYAIAKDHRGELECESRERVGTVFRLVLPVASGDEDRMNPIASSVCP